MNKQVPALAVLVALSTSLASCGDPAKAVAQRDVYTGPDAVERCIADWGNEELCTHKISEEEAKQLAAKNHGGGSTNVMIIPIGGIFGPSYSGERAVTHNGQRWAPVMQRSNNTATYTGLTPSARPSFSAPRPAATPSVSSPSVSAPSAPRAGGFGSTGTSISSGAS